MRSEFSFEHNKKLKEPLLLTRFDGLSHGEAASVLGVSVKAIEMRLHRARQILARALDVT